MSTRIEPLQPGESPDEKVNEIVQQSKEGWWQDSAMFGTIGRRPELLKRIVPLFEAFFLEGQVDPHIHEMMRLKTGQINDCNY